MNKLLLALLSMACLCSHIDAQSNRVSLGLKAGLNYSNEYDSQGEDFVADAKAGFAGGAFLSIPIGKYFGVQPEILLSQRGFKATGNLLGSDYSLTRTSTYIDVPLQLAIRPVSFISILVGPQFSYLSKQKDVFDNRGTATVLQEQEFKNDDLRKNTLCFTGGIDIVVKRVVLGARAGWDIQNNQKDGSSSTPRYKNAWLQATIGFKIL